jgi:hypothetical protein
VRAQLSLSSLSRSLPLSLIRARFSAGVTAPPFFALARQARMLGVDLAGLGLVVSILAQHGLLSQIILLDSACSWAKVSYLVWDSMMIGIVNWKGMRFRELKDDLSNPTDREVNKIFPVRKVFLHIKVFQHICLTVWLFLLEEITLLLANLLILAWYLMMLNNKPYFVDASKVYTPNLKTWAQPKFRMTMGFYTVTWLVYVVVTLYSVVTLTGDYLMGYLVCQIALLEKGDQDVVYRAMHNKLMNGIQETEALNNTLLKKVRVLGVGVTG